MQALEARKGALKRKRFSQPTPIKKLRIQRLWEENESDSAHEPTPVNEENAEEIAPAPTENKRKLENKVVQLESRIEQLEKDAVQHKESLRNMSDIVRQLQASVTLASVSHRPDVDDAKNKSTTAEQKQIDETKAHETTFTQIKEIAILEVRKVIMCARHSKL